MSLVYFPPEAKARMGELIDNLLVAMEESIEELEWMTPDTKVMALDKLAKFTPEKLATQTSGVITQISIFSQMT